MTRLAASSCQRCGVRISTASAGTVSQPSFCSCGCAALAGIPVDANGNFPINAHLLRLILVGALYFNQLLVWAVSSVLIHQERLVTAKRLSKVDLILAVAVWVSILVVQKCERVFRRKDLALALLSAVIMATVVLRDLSPLPTLAAVNAALLIWNFRSVFRRAAENGSVEKV